MKEASLAEALEFRPMRREELDLAVSWAASEGWNPGKHDADIFWATDPEGFVCATLEGEVVATGSIVSYGGEFGFMGFFIVKPGLRGQGLGTRFWFYRRDTLKGRLQPGAAIGMDGVFAMQDWYAQGGFTFSHRNLRMEGIGGEGISAGELPSGMSVTKLTELPFPEVAAFDRRHFGFDREIFLRAWIDPKEGLALGAVTSEGSLSGYGVARACQTGYKIGPLFAEDAATAETLFDALSTHADGQPLFLDVPEVNQPALDLAERHGMKEVFGCARMHCGPAPDLPWQNIFGITTFELG